MRQILHQGCFLFLNGSDEKMTHGAIDGDGGEKEREGRKIQVWSILVSFSLSPFSAIAMVMRIAPLALACPSNAMASHSLSQVSTLLAAVRVAIHSE